MLDSSLPRIKPVLKRYAWLCRCTDLLAELEAAQASSSQSQQQLQSALQDQQLQHLQWETEKTQLQVTYISLTCLS